MGSMPEPFYDEVSQEFFVCSEYYKIHKFGKDQKWSIVDIDRCSDFDVEPDY